MPVKTGRKLPRARVDAKVAQAAVRLARHVPAAPSTAGSAKVPSTPPARPSKGHLERRLAGARPPEEA